MNRNSNRHILIIFACVLGALFFATSSYAQNGEAGDALPDQRGFVSDYADLFDDATEENLVNALTEIRATSGLELNVLVVDTTGDMSIDEYGSQILADWGYDEEDEVKRQMLFLIAVEDAVYRMITTPALEGLLSDQKLEQISNEIIIPSIPDQGLPMAIVLGIDGIVDAYGDALENSQPVHRSSGGGNRLISADFLGILVIVAILAAISYLSRVLG